MQVLGRNREVSGSTCRAESLMKPRTVGGASENRIKKRGDELRLGPGGGANLRIFCKKKLKTYKAPGGCCPQTGGGQAREAKEPNRIRA